MACPIPARGGDGVDLLQLRAADLPLHDQGVPLGLEGREHRPEGEARVLALQAVAVRLKPQAAWTTEGN